MGAAKMFAALARRAITASGSLVVTIARPWSSPNRIAAGLGTFGSDHLGADDAGQRHFGDGDQRTAVAECRAPRVTRPRAISLRMSSPAGARRQDRPAAARRRGGHGQTSSHSDWPTCPVEWPISMSVSPSALNAIVALFSQSSSKPTPPIAGVGRIATAAARRLALVVERDVAAHDREVERAAGFAHAFERSRRTGP